MKLAVALGGGYFAGRVGWSREAVACRGRKVGGGRTEVDGLSRASEEQQDASGCSERLGVGVRGGGGSMDHAWMGDLST